MSRMRFLFLGKCCKKLIAVSEFCERVKKFENWAKHPTAVKY